MRDFYCYTILSITFCIAALSFFPIEAQTQQRVSKRDSLRSEKALNEGRLKSDRMNYAQAIVDFDMAIKFNAANWRAYQAKANAEQQLKEFSKAIEDYTAALQFRRDTVSLTGRAEAYAAVGLDSLSVVDYSEAIKIQPDNYELHYQRGGRFMILGDLRRAIDDFSACIVIDRTKSRAYDMRSRSFCSLGDYKQAISDFKTYMQLDGRDKTAFYYASFAYLGLANIAKENIDSAFNFAREYQMLGGRKNVNVVLGVYFGMKHDSLKSREYFRKASTGGENPKVLYLNWASVEFENANYAIAKKLYDSLINESKIPEAHFFFDRGVVEARLCDLRAALNDFDHAISLDPDFSKAYEGKLGIALYLDEPEQLRSLIAYADKKTVTTTVDSVGLSFRLRSFLRAKVKDFPNAYRDVGLAIEKNPQDPINYILKGIIAEELNYSDAEVVGNYLAARAPVSGKTRAVLGTSVSL